MIRPTLDRDWSVLGRPLGYTAVPRLVRSDAGVELIHSEFNLHIDHSPALGARGCRCVPFDALIPHSWLLKGCCERGGYVALGGRLLSALSRLEIEVLSASLRGEAQIVGGVLELGYYRAAGDGQAFPTRERNRVLD